MNGKRTALKQSITSCIDSRQSINGDKYWAKSEMKAALSVEHYFTVASDFGIICTKPWVLFVLFIHLAVDSPYTITIYKHVAVLALKRLLCSQ